MSAPSTLGQQVAKAVLLAPIMAYRYTLSALVARGLTTRQIATELSISEHTVATHVGRILNKLGLSSRSRLAAWVSDR